MTLVCSRRAKPGSGGDSVFHQRAFRLASASLAKHGSRRRLLKAKPTGTARKEGVHGGTRGSLMLKKGPAQRRPIQCDPRRRNGPRAVSYEGDGEVGRPRY